jgi:hypothetical protein
MNKSDGKNSAVADLKLPPDAATKINQVATGEPKAA